MTDGFMLMYKDLPGLQVVVHSIPSYPLLRDLVDVVLLPDGWARTATSLNEAQACRIWTITVTVTITVDAKSENKYEF